MLKTLPWLLAVSARRVEIYDASNFSKAHATPDVCRVLHWPTVLGNSQQLPGGTDAFDIIMTDDAQMFHGLKHEESSTFWRAGISPWATCRGNWPN